MAVKSQIDIDVDANEFLAFKGKFDEYAAALAKAPAAWRGIGREMDVARTKFETIANGEIETAATLATATAVSVLIWDNSAMTPAW